MELVQEIHQLLMDREDTCHRYSLDSPAHHGKRTLTVGIKFDSPVAYAQRVHLLKVSLDTPGVYE